MGQEMINASVFKEARDIALHCKDARKRAWLRSACDECKEVFDRFTISASVADMELLVCMWTRLLTAIAAVAPLTPPDPPAGRLREDLDSDSKVA